MLKSITRPKKRSTILLKLGVTIPIVLIVTFFLYPLTFFTSVQSQSAEELAAQIEEEQNRLNNTQKEIQALQKQLEQNKDKLKNAEEGLPKLQAELKELETQLELVQKRQEEFENRHKLLKLTKENLEKNQKNSLTSSYKEWRSSNYEASAIFDRNLSYLKEQLYSRRVFGIGVEDINEVSTVLAQVEKELSEYTQSSKKLEEEREALASRKAQLENNIRYFNSFAANAPAQIGQLQDRQSSINNKIAALTQEQQAAAQQEEWILTNPQNPNPTPIQPPPADNGSSTGTFSISGKGRDSNQGHGVGMSQWGMYGAALQGWSASQIVNFYYKQTEIRNHGGIIHVQGDTALEGYVNKTMNLNDYVAGLGEVPDKACGNAQQAQQNPAKYVVDNPNTMWDCWPEEAIKAQVIAARTYAASNGGSICTTAACQVYKGGNAKKWAADETSNQVIVSLGSTHNGQPIRALYSSDNSQGSGTAHNDTIFQNLYGDGTPHSYLRAVNDSAFATPTSWTNWAWQSNRYSYESLWGMLDFAANFPGSGYNESTRNAVRAMMNSIGNIQSVSFERDPSGRVKKVFFKGSNGATATMGGWWFKNIWNNWTYVRGSTDYVYSQTFYWN